MLTVGAIEDLVASLRTNDEPRICERYEFALDTSYAHFHLASEFPNEESLVRCTVQRRENATTGLTEQEIRQGCVTCSHYENKCTHIENMVIGKASNLGVRDCTQVYTGSVKTTFQTDAQAYRYIRNEIVHSGVAPSLRDICRVVGFASPRSAQLLLARLEKQGLLTYSEGQTKLSPLHTTHASEQTVSVPLVGSIACGIPSLAEQTGDATINVSTRLAKPGGRYFLLRATGTSMNRSGIDDGALILVKQQQTAADGDMVVALIDDEATVKHFHHDTEMVVLKPNSTDSAHKPIVLTDDFSVQGVVVAVLPGNLI